MIPSLEGFPRLSEYSCNSFSIEIWIEFLKQIWFPYNVESRLNSQKHWAMPAFSS